MKNFKLLFALAVSLLLLFAFGCSNGAEDNQINFGLIASEKTLPTDFDKIAFERDTTPYFQYLVRKVDNKFEFEETWKLYGFENKTPNVNFNEKDVIFIGVQESGSCPYKIENIELSSDNKAITVPLAEPDGACTSDATPRTFVIEIDKEISKVIENIVIVQSGVETSIPFNNNLSAIAWRYVPE